MRDLCITKQKPDSPGLLELTQSNLITFLPSVGEERLSLARLTKSLTFTKEKEGKILFKKPDKSYTNKSLDDFWLRVGGKSNNGKGVSSKIKLELLKAYAEEIRFEIVGGILKKRRAKFVRNKQHKNMFWKYTNCFICGNSSEIRHHIIELQYGGTNQSKNLVMLCKACHAEIHPWLKV